MSAHAPITEIEAEGESMDAKITELLAILEGMKADREELEEHARRLVIAKTARISLIVESAMFLREAEGFARPRSAVLQ